MHREMPGKVGLLNHPAPRPLGLLLHSLDHRPRQRPNQIRKANQSPLVESSTLPEGFSPAGCTQLTKVDSKPL
jgi:hypothetical protein